MVNTDKKTIDSILNRGIIVEVLPALKEFRNRLLSGDKLRFYIGADPTSPSLHLSHAKNYMLLEEFRNLGHEVIVLIGDFTARIGDPTDQTAVRKQLSREDVVKNVENWLEQIKLLMDFETSENPPKILYNHDWLSKLTMEDVVNLASNVTVQRMLERDMFKKRIEQKKPIFLHEFMYPLMQGYDSVKMEVDVEMCGTDQIFNALVGRTLLKKLKNKEKFIVAVNLMENPKTGELMSKSRGTGVFLDSSTFDMFGAIMSQPDEMIEVLLVNNTRTPLSEVKKIKKMPNQRDAKMIVAFEITKIFHGESEAIKAKSNFIKTFQKKELPDDVKEIVVKKGDELRDTLLLHKIVDSVSDFRRLIKGGAIDFGGATLNDVHYKIEKSGVARIGKKSFIKLLVS
jgi:tyrosyl-tRNA synthetase